MLPDNRRFLNSPTSPEVRSSPRDARFKNERDLQAVAKQGFYSSPDKPTNSNQDDHIREFDARVREKTAVRQARREEAELGPMLNAAELFQQVRATADSFHPTPTEIILMQDMLHAMLNIGGNSPEDIQAQIDHLPERKRIRPEVWVTLSAILLLFALILNKDKDQAVSKLPASSPAPVPTAGYMPPNFLSNPNRLIPLGNPPGIQNNGSVPAENVGQSDPYEPGLDASQPEPKPEETTLIRDELELTKEERQISTTTVPTSEWDKLGIPAWTQVNQLSGNDIFDPTNTIEGNLAAADPEGYWASHARPELSVFADRVGQGEGKNPWFLQLPPEVQQEMEDAVQQYLEQLVPQDPVNSKEFYEMSERDQKTGYARSAWAYILDRGGQNPSDPAPTPRYAGWMQVGRPASIYKLSEYPPSTIQVVDRLLKVKSQIESHLQLAQGNEVEIPASQLRRGVLLKPHGLLLSIDQSGLLHAKLTGIDSMHDVVKDELVLSPGQNRVITGEDSEKNYHDSGRDYEVAPNGLLLHWIDRQYKISYENEVVKIEVVKHFSTVQLPLDTDTFAQAFSKWSGSPQSIQAIFDDPKATWILDANRPKMRFTSYSEPYG